MNDDVSIAFVTMVRDEPFFLPRWIAHYARHVPKSRLFILLDGGDQQLPREAEGCQIISLPRRPPAAGWDRNRWDLLSNFAGTLLTRFEIVVVNDVDELIVTDPGSGEDLVTALSRARDCGVLSPFALEIIHRLDRDSPSFDYGRPILEQRRHARLNASYCKPCILSKPVCWSVGGHYSDFPVLNLDRNLYLFHLRFIDLGMLVRRQGSRNEIMSLAARDNEAWPEGGEVAGSGWSKSSEDMKQFLQSFVAKGEPIDNDLDFGWQRRKIQEHWSWDEKQGVWKHPRLHNRRTYVIPDRFLGLF